MLLITGGAVSFKTKNLDGKTFVKMIAVIPVV
jgi:hypothetical protein